jgi:hypothetical protein
MEWVVYFRKYKLYNKMSLTKVFFTHYSQFLSLFVVFVCQRISMEELMKEITNCLNTIDQQITIFLRIKRNELSL